MSDITVSVDLRPDFGPARNQGPRPTCMAFAASDAHAGLRNDWAPLSCEYAFYQAQRRAGRPPNKGALLSSMLKAVEVDGQPAENGWPYLAATPSDETSWRPPAKVGSLFRRAGAESKPTLDHLIEGLNAGRAAIILLTLSRSFFTPDPRAVIHPAAGELPDPARRHAVIALGHGVVDGRRAILVRNSWGDRWGDAGHGWLTEPFLEPRIFAAAMLMEEVDVSAHPVAA